MSLFHIVEDAYAITTCRGVYKHCKVFQRDGRLFASHGAGYIALYTNNGTSIPHVRLHDIILPFPKQNTALGYLIYPTNHNPKTTVETVNKENTYVKTKNKSNK